MFNRKSSTVIKIKSMIYLLWDRPVRLIGIFWKISDQDVGIWKINRNLRVVCTFSILWLWIQIVFHLSIRNYVEQWETVLFPSFDFIGYFQIWKKFRTSTPSQWRQWFQVFCALFQTSCCTCCQNIFAAKRTFWVNDSFIT